MSQTKARDELFRMICGFQISQAIIVATDLGLADHLRSGPRCCRDLATATGTHAGSLGRLLRTLAALGVLQEDEHGRFALTAVGEYLRSDVAGSHAPLATLLGRPYVWAAWVDLVHSVRVGSPAFDHVHGRSVWQYRAQHPEDGAIFDRAMGAGTSVFAQAVMAVTDFGRFKHIVDVGGGDGSFLAELLGTHGNLTATLLDQPHVIDAPGAIDAKPEATRRCRKVAGDFFTSVPAGADAYLLKWILHDWDDEAAIQILRTCRRAMKADSRLVLVENLIGTCNDQSLATLMDLNMMVLTGGKVRTRADHCCLFEEAGLQLVSVMPTNSPLWVIEASPIAN